MPNYQEGKIYTIRNYTDDSLIYVGSTTQTLAKRLVKHRTDCKTGKSGNLYFYIIDNDWSNWYIELYEHYPCNERVELNKREGEVIREVSTINKNIAGRNIEEYRKENADKIKERDKEYYKNNVDKIKKYYEENTDKIKKNQKEYYKKNAEKLKKLREDNADKIKRYNKKYYENNKKNEEKVCCNICGSFLKYTNLLRHQKSIKCMSSRI